MASSVPSTEFELPVDDLVAPDDAGVDHAGPVDTE